jgi:hypothetical protein
MAWGVSRVNDRQCRPRLRGAGWLLLGATVLLVSPMAALAELVMTVAATSDFQYNSNVFDTQSGFANPFGGTRSGDSYVNNGGKLDASYLWSQQQFYATLTGNDYHFGHFKQLDHSEYNLDGGWDWKIGRVLDGIFDVDRIRSAVSFYNLVDSSLVIQTEQRETARAGLQVNPDWRTELTGITRTVDQPQLLAPDLSLRETSGQLGIKYTGTAGVTAGIAATYLKGTFEDVGPTAVAPSYNQKTAALTATDEVNGQSTFRGNIGYTRRSSDSGINSVSGVTGEVDYRRALTGKTAAEIDLTRQVNAYLTNDASEIDSAAALTVTWQATYKIAMVLGYTYTYRQLPGQGNALVGGMIVPNDSNRVDRLNFATLSLSYTPVQWLILKPYISFQNRTSQDFVGGRFDSNVIGAQFSLQWQRGTIPPRSTLY